MPMVMLHMVAAVAWRECVMCSQEQSGYTRRPTCIIVTFKTLPLPPECIGMTLMVSSCPLS